MNPTHTWEFGIWHYSAMNKGDSTQGKRPGKLVIHVRENKIKSLTHSRHQNRLQMEKT